MSEQSEIHPGLSEREAPKRRCFWIDPSQVPDEGGYVPSLVVEGEPGHSPMRGDPAKFQSPWYWGKTLVEANSMAIKMNYEQFGLGPSQCNEIVLSSMGASPDSTVAPESEQEIDLTVFIGRDALSHVRKGELLIALDDAIDRGKLTWIVYRGNRVAAIAPAAQVMGARHAG